MRNMKKHSLSSRRHAPSPHILDLREEGKKKKSLLDKPKSDKNFSFSRLQRKARAFYSFWKQKERWHRPRSVRARRGFRAPHFLAQFHAKERVNAAFQRSVVSRAFQMRQVMWFVGFALAVVLPVQAYYVVGNIQNLQGRIEGYVRKGVEELRNGNNRVFSAQFIDARKSFQDAQEAFFQAADELGSFGAALDAASFLIKDISLGRDIISIGKFSSQAGEMVAQAAQYMMGEEGGIWDGTGVTSRISLALASLNRARVFVDRIQEIMAGISPGALPEEVRDQFIKGSQGIFRAQTVLDAANEVGGYALRVLGHERPRRYLFVFQNNDELRPSGGFIGSMALLTLEKGEVVDMEVPGGGPYDLQGSLAVGVRAPEPLWLVQPRWQIQDANWWPDWPASAKKIMWFYEYSGGESVDGVIAVTPDVMEDILDIIGPIEMDSYGVSVSKNSFRRTTQEMVELYYDRSKNRPKQFLADMAPIVIDKIRSLPPEKMATLAARMMKRLASKDIIAYFSDPVLQNQTQEFGWAGEVRTSPGDYAMVVEANIGGGKTDRSIGRTIRQEIRFMGDGTIVRRIQLIRRHGGDPGDIFTGAVNNAYIRFYIPAGSTLTNAIGFAGPGREHFKEPPESYLPDEDVKRIQGEKILYNRWGVEQYMAFGKTVVGGWQVIRPGEEKVVEIEYILPWRFAVEPEDFLEKGLKQAGFIEAQGGRYSLLVQKQPGVSPSMEIAVGWDTRTWKPVWYTGKSSGSELEGKDILMWKGELDKDTAIGLVFSRKNKGMR